MLKIADYILMATLIVFAISFNFFLVKLTGPTRDVDYTDYLIVTVSGELYQQYPLSVDGIYTIETGRNNTNTNTFEIQNGIVKMTHASCSDQLCVNFKPMEKNNEFILCLPNEVFLEIHTEDEEKESEIDSFVQ